MEKILDIIKEKNATVNICLTYLNNIKYETSNKKV